MLALNATAVFELSVLLLCVPVLINGAINLTVSPLCVVPTVIVAVVLPEFKVIFDTSTAIPPAVSSVSLIRIQFVLLAFVPNTSPVTVVVNVAEPPDTDSTLISIILPLGLAGS